MPDSLLIPPPKKKKNSKTIQQSVQDSRQKFSVDRQVGGGRQAVVTAQYKRKHYSEVRRSDNESEARRSLSSDQSGQEHPRHGAGGLARQQLVESSDRTRTGGLLPFQLSQTYLASVS